MYYFHDDTCICPMFVIHYSRIDENDTEPSLNYGQTTDDFVGVSDLCAEFESGSIQ